MQLPGPSTAVTTNIAQRAVVEVRSRACAVTAVGAAGPPVPRDSSATDNVPPTHTALVRSVRRNTAATVRRFQGQQILPGGRLADLVHLPACIAESNAPALPRQRESEVTEDPRLAWWQPRPRGRLATALQLPGPSAPILTEQSRPNRVIRHAVNMHRASSATANHDPEKAEVSAAP